MQQKYARVLEDRAAPTTHRSREEKAARFSRNLSIFAGSDNPLHYCPTTGDGIGPITTPKIGPIPTPHTETGLGPIETGNPNGIFGPSDSVFGPSKSPFGPQGFDSGMSFPGMPDSAETTPDDGGVAPHGY